jgi:hypothetical protein
MENTMNLSQKVRAALDNARLAEEGEAAVRAEMKAAEAAMQRTGRISEAPTRELHDRWKDARHATDEAWAKVMEALDQEMHE